MNGEIPIFGFWSGVIFGSIITVAILYAMAIRDFVRNKNENNHTR